MKKITRTVWILGMVSLFTDMASEMLYPIMPIYLQSIGFSVLLIGILEGLAEATAGLSKGYFGERSDRLGKRVPFVRLGYSLSAISKPLMGIFRHPAGIFLARTMDRFGKGVRTGARDAILSAESTPATRGAVFGFHRAMDTLGAVLGPLLALIYLYYYPEDYVNLFFIAFIPGLLAVASTFRLKEKPLAVKNNNTSGKLHFFSFINYWKRSPLAYRKLVAGLLLFTLINSSDMFLILKSKDAGLGDTQVVGLYIFYNFIYALFAFPLGSLADRWGLKKVFVSGLVLYGSVYFGMAGAGDDLAVYILLFVLYGLFAAATQGVSKAWISNLVKKEETATAIGFYTGFQSLFALAASSLAGLLWYRFGAPVLFYSTAAVAALLILYFIILIPKPKSAQDY